MRVLPNNLTLVHRQTTSNRVVAVQCLARPGATADPPERAGRSHLMTRLLTKGTSTRSSDDIARIIENAGARLGAGASHDAITVSLKCVRDDLERLFPVFTDVILDASFPIDEIETERERQLTAIRMREDRPPSAALRRFRRELFSTHAYGIPVEGEPDTVPLITQRDLVLARNQVFRPENMTISIVGDLTLEAAEALVRDAFGGLELQSQLRAESRKTFSQTGGLFEEFRRIEQGFIAMGCHAPALGTSDAVAVETASAVLGAGMSSRLFTELRDRRGLAYMVGAMAGQQRDAGYFCAYIGTSGPNIDDASQALWAEVERLKTEPVATEELERAKAYIKGEFLRDHETTSQQAFYLGMWQFFGMGIDYDTRFPALVDAVTSRDIMRVANKYFNNPTVIVLRPLGEIEPAGDQAGDRAE